jgi:rhodanese-related sulfurtransferase
MSDPALDARGLPAGYPLKERFETTPREVKRRLDAGDETLVLLDCRTGDEWNVAKVPGSVLIPLHELEDRLDELDEARDKTVAVICHHGNRSLRAAMLLQDAGFPGARSVAGGIELWSLDVDRSIPRYDRGSGRSVIIPGP